MSWHRHSPAVLFTHVHRWQAQLARLAARKAPFAQMPEAQLWFPNSYCRRLKSCWVQPKVWCFPTMCTKEEVKIQEMQYWKSLAWEAGFVCRQLRTLARWFYQFYLLYCVALYFVLDAHNVEFLLGWLMHWDCQVVPTTKNGMCCPKCPA